MRKIESEEIRGSSVCILGFGREGKSAYRFLSNNHPELDIAIADRREDLSFPPNVTTHTGKNYLSKINKYETLIRSPGISYFDASLSALRSSGTHVSSATNLFFSVAPGKKIAITGTKGKSTTSALIAHILAKAGKKVHLVGNIGKPALDSLEEASDDSYFVVECSSFQLEDFSYSADISVVLEIVEEHLDYHNNFDNYLKAKLQICANATADELLIYNPGNTLLRERLEDVSCREKNFGEGQEICLQDSQITTSKHGNIVSCDELKILGPGNIQNALAASAVALALNIDPQILADSLRTFSSLEHRLEKLGEFAGVTFYNDSLSTIPQATMNALVALGDQVDSLIVGGHDRGLNFFELAKAIAKSSVRNLITLPNTGELIWQCCSDLQAEKIKHFPAKNMTEAVAHAFKETRQGKCCLLSPASSSLNLFRDYQHRAECFYDEIRKQDPTS